MPHAATKSPEEKRFQLILGKIIPPQPPRDAVLRSRLLEEIRQSENSIVTLVAPAGFGKTLVMGQLFETEPHAKSWLTLDDRDNDYGRLLVYLHAALSRVVELPALASPRGGSAQPYARHFSDSQLIVDVVASSQQPFTLFLDDFEKLQEAESIRLVRSLILALSPGQRIVIGSRTMRLLPLASLGVQGHIMRIETDSLRFDLTETTRFMSSQTALSMTRREIALIKDRAEGWPAGLRMITLALPRVSDPRSWLETLSRHTDNMEEYLAENVLERLPERERQFMVHCSVLESMSGKLCDAVLQTQGSEQLISEIYRGNLFLAPLTPNSEWYKFHALFRDFLLAELRRIDPGAIPGLHRRAASWLLKERNFSAAIAHALQTGDDALAADSMEQCAMEFVRESQIETVAKWVNSIPRAEVTRRPRLQRARAYAMIALNRHDEALDALTQLRDAAHSEGREVEEEVTVQFALLYEWTDRHDKTEAELSKAPPSANPHESLLSSTRNNITAYLRILKGDFTEARRLLSLAKPAYQRKQLGLWSNTYTLCFEGVIEMIQGQAAAATERFEAAFAHSTGAGLSVASTYLAEALYERHDLERAGAIAEEHLRLIREIGHPDALILSYRTAARVALLEGHNDRAISLLTELGDLGDIRGLARLKASAWLEKSRLALLSGDNEAAERYLTLGSDARAWAAHRGFRPYPQEIDDPQIASIRFSLATRSIEKIIPQLEEAIAQTRTTGRNWRRIRLQTLLAQAYSVARQRGNALRVLEEAVSSASRHALVHVFADEPWFLPDLLTELGQRCPGIEPAYLEKLMAATGMTTQRTVVLSLARTDDELLTLREAEIMRLVAVGRVNKEVARILSISENTVETHLRRINQKLGTHNRTQAVAKASGLGLL